MKITEVKYLDEYNLWIKFSDKSTKIVSFKNFIFNSDQPEVKQLKNKNKFTLIGITSVGLKWVHSGLEISAADVYRWKDIPSNVKAINDAIEAQGRKMGNIADNIGCARTHLSFVLNGHRTLTPELEDKIKKYLGI